MQFIDSCFFLIALVISVEMFSIQMGESQEKTDSALDDVAEKRQKSAT